VLGPFDTTSVVPALTAVPPRSNAATPDRGSQRARTSPAKTPPAASTRMPTLARSHHTPRARRRGCRGGKSPRPANGEFAAVATSAAFARFACRRGEGVEAGLPALAALVGAGLLDGCGLVLGRAWTMVPQCLHLSG